MTERFSLKGWLHLIGGGLGLIGVIFVAVRLYAHVRQINLARFDLVVWLILALLTCAYGAGNLFLARAWWHLLHFFNIKTSWPWAIKVYGRSQLAKYIPGNIFHLAGRQALGMAAGLPSRPLVKSALWELGLLACAGFTFCIPALPLLWSNFALWISIALFMVLLLMLGAEAYRRFAPDVVYALTWQITFLIMSGVVFSAVLAVIVTDSNELPPMSVLCSAYVLAWLAGFITPGTPAGLGVREMALYFLIGHYVSHPDLLLAITLGRIITIVGDLLFFVFGSLNVRDIHGTDLIV